MILWSGKPSTYPGALWVGVRWRWALELSWCSLFMVRQRSAHGADFDLGPSGSYAGLFFSKHFSLGGEHTYYDGPHCSFSLGFLHISWSLDYYCKKCTPDNE